MQILLTAQYRQYLHFNLKSHIITLSSDDFEGRETGTAGETKAANYLTKQFKSIGLKAKGESGYLQKFKFNSGATFGSSTQLVVNNYIFKNGEDFYPLPFSGNAVVTNFITKVSFGITDTKLNRDDFKGKLNIKYCIDYSCNIIAKIEIG